MIDLKINPNKLILYVFNRAMSFCASWFYSNTSRVQSEDVLQADGREGVFLVRDSSQKDMYTLSVFTRSGGYVTFEFNGDLLGEIQKLVCASCMRVFSLENSEQCKKHVWYRTAKGSGSGQLFILSFFLKGDRVLSTEF